MLSKNNWIDISWSGNIPRLSHEDIECTFNEKTNKIIDFDTACDQTAHEIANQFDNLYIAFSGGLDSEYLANVLVRNKIPFTPILIRINELSKVESFYAVQWCKKRNITPHIIDLSLDDYCKIIKRYSKNKFKMPYIILPCYAGEYVTGLGGKLLTGAQLGYFPDEQKSPAVRKDLKDYSGFTIAEMDMYIECGEPDTHPWAFYYWSPTIMASLVNAWDTSLNMQENK
jgi:hypothetical protein